MSKLHKQVKRMWWDIKDVAFNGTNISRRNGMFMSTANSISVGSIFEIKKNFFGYLKDENLKTSYKTLKSNYSDCPNIFRGQPKSTSSFTLDTSSKAGLDIVASYMDKANINEINAELSSLISKAKKMKVEITKWGIDYIEEDEFSLFLARHLELSDNRIERVLDGDNYIATKSIWIEGIKFSSKLDEETTAKIKAIYDTNQQAFINADVKFDFSSSMEISYDFNFKEKFSPFLKFRKIEIEKKGDYINIASASLPNNDVFFDDVDLTTYTV